MHLEPPLITLPVNAWIFDAVSYALADDDPNAAVHIRAGLEALPVQLQLFAIEALRAFSVGADDPQGRVAAARVLEMLVV